MLEYLLCVAVLSACILIAFQSYTGAKNGPPGPKGYPFFGVIFEVDVLRLHEKLYEWTQQYGDVFQFQMLGKKFLCINSVEVLRETFLQEPCATINAYRSPTFTGKYLLKNYSDVIFASPSSLWEKRRKFVYRLLHTYGEGITSLENQVLQNLIRFKGKIRQNISKDVNPFEIVDEFILSTIETLVCSCFIYSILFSTLKFHFKSNITFYLIYEIDDFVYKNLDEQCLFFNSNGLK